VTQTRPRLRAYTVVGLSGIGRIPYEETRTNFRPRASGWSHHISQTDVNPIRRLLPLTTPVLPLNGMLVISTRMPTSTSRFIIHSPLLAMLPESHPSMVPLGPVVGRTPRESHPEPNDASSLRRNADSQRGVPTSAEDQRPSLNGVWKIRDDYPRNPFRLRSAARNHA